MQETSHNRKIDIAPTKSDADVTSESALQKTARHISKRTTDLIAMAIVSIGILTVSGRLAEWWKTDAASIPSPVVSANLSAGSIVRWGAGESAVSLLAGEQPVSMERRVLFGDQDRVDGILRDRLVSMLESSQAESTSTDGNQHGKVRRVDTKFADQEKRLIGMLQELTPFETRNGHWNLYRLDHANNPIPGSFLIATRMSPHRDKAESLSAWAVATPSGPDQWTSFLLTPAETERNQDQHITPVPPDGQLLISLSADTRDELTVFQRLNASHSDVGRWVREMGRQLLAAGWHETRAWQQSKTSATARFEHQTDEKRRAMELSISLSNSGKLTGLSNVIAIPKMILVPADAIPR